MNRSPTSSSDRRIFSQTAASTKVINLGVVPFRGGIRL